MLEKNGVAQYPLFHITPFFPIWLGPLAMHWPFWVKPWMDKPSKRSSTFCHNHALYNTYVWIYLSSWSWRMSSAVYRIQSLNHLAKDTITLKGPRQTFWLGERSPRCWNGWHLLQELTKCDETVVSTRRFPENCFLTEVEYKAFCTKPKLTLEIAVGFLL